MSSISIIITSYNQINYLKETIESALTQTIPAHEIIISDDCSNDGSQELIQAYARRFPDLVRVFVNENNLGISENRNSALRQATGEFVAISDGDDRYTSRFIEVMQNKLVHKPQNHCVYSNIFFIDALGNRIGKRDHQPQPEGEILHYLATGRMSILRSMIASSDIVRRIGLLDRRFRNHDGYIFTLKLAQQSGYSYILDPLVEYRVHSLSMSRLLKSSDRLRDLQDVFSETIQICSRLNNNQLREIRSIWYARLLRLQVRSDIEAGKPISGLWKGVKGMVSHPSFILSIINYMRLKKQFR